MQNLAHEPQVMKEGLTQLQQVLEQLKPLYSKKKKHKHTTSILLHELAQSPSLETAFTTPSATPLLHAMSAAHGFVVMFVHVCRTGQVIYFINSQNKTVLWENKTKQIKYLWETSVR